MLEGASEGLGSHTLSVELWTPLGVAGGQLRGEKKMDKIITAMLVGQFKTPKLLSGFR